MGPKQESHLERIKTEVCDLLDSKYRAGQEEHGGYLPEHPRLMLELTMELIDAIVYALTLKEQLAAIAERTRLQAEDVAHVNTELLRLEGLKGGSKGNGHGAAIIQNV